MSQTIQQNESLPLPYGVPLSEVGPLPNRSVGNTRKLGDYIFEHSPDHPAARKDGYVLQHRLVAEAVLGRFLYAREVVHHDNGDKLDNSVDNLWLFPNQKEHISHHNRKSEGAHDAEYLHLLQETASDPDMSYRKASEKMGWCISTYKKYLHIHSIQWVSPRRYRTEDEVREALNGRSNPEAAKELGISLQTLHNNFGHLLSKRTARQGFLEPHKEEIRSLARHTSLNQIALKFHTQHSTVNAAVRRWAKQEPDAWSDVLAALPLRKGWQRKPQHKASSQ